MSRITEHIEFAAFEGRVGFLDAMKGQGVDIPHTVCAQGIKGNRPEVLVWAKANGVPLGDITLAECMCARTEILQYLHKEGFPVQAYRPAPPCKDPPAWVFAMKGDFEGLKNAVNYESPSMICEKAALFGHLDILKWAIEKGLPVTPHVRSGAEQERYTEILDYLTEMGYTTVEGLLPTRSTVTTDDRAWLKEHGYINRNGGWYQ